MSFKSIIEELRCSSVQGLLDSAQQLLKTLDEFHAAVLRRAELGDFSTLSAAQVEQETQRFLHRLKAAYGVDDEQGEG